MTPPTAPLYKYLSLSAALNPPWHERLRQLLEGQCYLASPSSFNDPFDCLPTFYSPKSPEELKEWQDGMVPAIANAIRKELPAWFAEQQVRQALAGVSIEEIGEKLKLAAAQNAKAMGVFCLAGRIDSVLMWSHYASNHTGIAVEFDFRGQTKSEILPLWQVRYQPDRPVIRDIYSPNPQLHLADALAIKAEFWRYEEEWRVMKPDHAEKIVQFEPKIITGIIFGANCSESDQRLIRQICANQPITFKKMRADSQTFSIIAEQDGDE